MEEEEYYDYEPEDVYEESFEEETNTLNKNSIQNDFKLENSNLVIKDNREIIVPGDIRFISDWKDYSLKWFQFPHILDKKIPGCGYTEYCIRTNLPIILCSPRKILLENKEEQHKDDVFYFRNELETDLEMDKDLTKVSKTTTTDPSDDNQDDKDKESELKTKRQEAYKKLRDNLIRYIDDRLLHAKSPKILVTYDSFRLVKEILIKRNIFSMFYVVVDEFQSIFTDSRFKSTTEMEFINQLYGIYRVCFVSATPMIDKYLKEMPEFTSLPYYEFNWGEENPNRIIKPDLKVRIIKSTTSQAKEIIQTYKNNEFEKSTKMNSDGTLQIIESKEAVFYVNSVSNIISIIKNSKLTPSECNILCAKTDTNIKRIKKRLGVDFEIGKVPLKGQPHKMFTFCTRTVYLGADFYSTNARSFILSDANVNCLAVDISLDLPQILGRQRDLNNPWKNRAEFYYRTLGKKNELTKDAFNKIIAEKKKVTSDLIEAFNTCKESAKQSLARKYQKDAKNSNYSDDYVAVNAHAGQDLIPVVNNLVLIAEQRAFDIQQVDYKDRFSVFNTIIENGMVSSESLDVINKFLDRFEKHKDFTIRMKMLCDIDLTEIERGILLDQIPLSYKNYYNTLGPERLYALGYNKTYVEREFSDLQFNINDLKEEIYKVFSEGSRYSKSVAKEILANLYKSLGYNKTPKANDLEKYFDLKECRVLNNSTGKRDAGFEIIKKKE